MFDKQDHRINVLGKSLLLIHYNKHRHMFKVFQITDLRGTMLFQEDRSYDGWQHLCISLTDLSNTAINILFGVVDQDGNLVETDSDDDNVAALALDDIGISEIPCPR